MNVTLFKIGLYIHSDCLVTFWFGTFTTQLRVLLVMNTQRWIVHCYEGLFITLQLWDFGIIITLCVRAIPMVRIVCAMPQTRGVSPYSQAGFGILTASQLCITHKSIEAYPLEAASDYSGGDQPVYSYSLSHHKDAGGRNKDNQEPCKVCGWFKLPGQD